MLLLAAVLLWYGNANSFQAESAMVADIYFDGEYCIADGPWQKIRKNGHIPASQGDVTLRGNFHLLTPDGEYVGIYSGDMPIALYLDHIHVTIYQEENEPYSLEMEDSLYGDSACGITWSIYAFPEPTDTPIEIKIHNPHRFGNETAIDKMLAGTALWTGVDFEKEILASGETQRNLGLLFAIIAILLLGTALFATLIHTQSANGIWILGGMILFAGLYLSYSAPGISFWSDSIVSNTTILGGSMMLYMLFLSIEIVHLLESTKTVGILTVSALGVMNGAFFLLPIVTDILFYDTWLYWSIGQGLGNAALLYCLIKESCAAKGKKRWLYIGLLLPLIAFGLDVSMTYLGIWKGGMASLYVFIVLFLAALIAILQVIPRNINAMAKARELESEKNALNAQLTQSRVSTMMSQIRPHFIYNTLGSIEQLCSIDPPKAGELVHNFAKYLRGNFGELDNPKPILMSQEMEHVRYYVSIEKVRFPDMMFSIEINARDFHIPALTVQPIVENAIKHGLMKLPKGGSIRVTAYETDDHYCVSVEDDGAGFDVDILQNKREHLGIRNISGRLKAMVGGKLTIESTVGVGTKVLITIPKEE